MLSICANLIGKRLTVGKPPLPMAIHGSTPERCAVFVQWYDCIIAAHVAIQGRIATSSSYQKSLTLTQNRGSGSTSFQPIAQCPCRIVNVERLREPTSTHGPRRPHPPSPCDRLQAQNLTCIKTTCNSCTLFGTKWPACWPGSPCVCDRPTVARL